MIEEATVISGDEWLLRRVHQSLWNSPRAFEPRVAAKNVRDPDLTGISLYRQACLADPIDILATVSPEKLPQYGIVAINVSALIELGLSVSLAPDPRVKGHVVIPELNADLYAQNRAPFIPIMKRLAELAAMNIIRVPIAGK